tara:strand:- start:939 stop:1775 length:837 start_codon:yes stop_codon:yes gene_type:complete
LDSSKTQSNQYVKNTDFYCKNFDLPNGRWYAKDEGKDPQVYFPSVTTVLSCLGKGKGFEMWLGNSPSYEHAMEYGLEAAKIGSIVHWYIMKLLQGEKINTKEGFLDEETEGKIKIGKKVNKRLEGFVKFYDDLKPRVMANEISLFNDHRIKGEYLFPWAGQADQIYEIDGKIIMCDNKTGKDYDTHGLQLTAYKLLWDSLFPDMIIDELWGLYLSDTWRKKAYTIKKYKFDPNMWLNTLEIWFWRNKGNKLRLPQPKFPKPDITEFELKIEEGEVKDV